MKARCSLGLSIHKYLGGFGEMLDSPVLLSVLDADKTVAFTLRQDSRLKPDAPAYIQFAILFTTPRGERRVRVFNYALGVTEQPSTDRFPAQCIGQMYSSIDMDAVLDLEAKQHVQTIQRSSVNNTRNMLCQTAINILSHYRKTVSTTSASAQFVLPESMKTYPLLLLGMLKTPGFGLIEDFKLDAKVASMMQFRSCSFASLVMRAYPRLYSISQIVDPAQPWGTAIMDNEAASGSIHKPTNIPASTEKIVPIDAYLIVNSDFIYVYLPPNVSEQILAEVFGKTTLAEVVVEEGLPVLESESSKRVHAVIDCLRKEKGGAYQQVKLLLPTSTEAKNVLRDMLTEDCKNSKKEFAYLTFLTHLHRMILSRVQSL